MSRKNKPIKNHKKFNLQVSARIETCDSDLIDAMGIKDLLFSQFNLADDVQFDNKMFSSSDQA